MKKHHLLVALLLALPLMAHAAGAIAVDDEEGDTEPGYGFVTGHDTRESAGKAALEECKSSGNEACKIVARFDTCGAYVASTKYYGVGWGNTKSKAIAMARDTCGEKCRIVVAECE